jgi:hypothetical protein
MILKQRRRVWGNNTDAANDFSVIDERGEKIGRIYRTLVGRSRGYLDLDGVQGAGWVRTDVGSSAGGIQGSVGDARAAGTGRLSVVHRRRIRAVASSRAATFSRVICSRTKSFGLLARRTRLAKMICKNWYSTLRTVSDHRAHRRHTNDSSVRAFAVKTRAFGAPLRGFGP